MLTGYNILSTFRVSQSERSIDKVWVSRVGSWLSLQGDPTKYEALLRLSCLQSFITSRCPLIVNLIGQWEGFNEEVAIIRFRMCWFWAWGRGWTPFLRTTASREMYKLESDCNTHSSTGSTSPSRGTLHRCRLTKSKHRPSSLP